MADLISKPKTSSKITTDSGTYILEEVFYTPGLLRHRNHTFFLIKGDPIPDDLFHAPAFQAFRIFFSSICFSASPHAFFNDYKFRVGIEFETDNVASVHRSINELAMGLQSRELDMIFLILPVFNLAQYLTDRVANYEEIEVYFPLLKDKPFIALGFDAENYSPDFPIFEKGKDGNAKNDN